MFRSTMVVTILDCYTDEAAGLGVPPYLGTYPRYLFGYFREQKKEVHYLTIDDIRLLMLYKNRRPEPSEKQKTNIYTYNTTGKDVSAILKKTTTLVVILGVHVPGKYLSAVPGTLREVVPLLKDLRCTKILTGPALFGTQLEGGKFSERIHSAGFDEESFDFSYDELRRYVVLGAAILKEIPDLRVLEIETGKGCAYGRCSFCTEPLKSSVAYRKTEDICAEIRALYDAGARYFRLGKQTCFYSFPEPIELLRKIRSECPDIKVLHIDNVNPRHVIGSRGEEITKALVKYATGGNVAAFGVESFDPEVIEQNALNCRPDIAFKAIEQLNRYGAGQSPNGMPMFLPGINIIFGLIGETKQTHTENIKGLQHILDEKWLIRRINVRQAAIFPETPLGKKAGNKFVRKNRQHYWKWRNDIRQNIDVVMLKRLVPVGTILSDVRMEIYDGMNTFGRQIGTYPLIVGVEKKRLELKTFYTIRVVGHMKRSIVGEPV
ncbi:radical SAM protein [Candidatus Woesearchaeota archaeon CG_4_10_14_0_8_um_filter_47_5]|nr:MAG: radical SAM protein [Candidatus Woesearchaeota archaeon CG_4_10_14_0_8_um_filter_47_5]